MLILGREGDDDVLGLEPEVADVAPLPLPPELLSAIRDRTHLLDERGEPEYVLFSEGRAVVTPVSSSVADATASLTRRLTGWVSQSRPLCEMSRYQTGLTPCLRANVFVKARP